MAGWRILTNDSEVLAIHAALMPTGTVLYFGGDEHNQAQNRANEIDNTRALTVEPTPVAIETLTSPTTDVFCAGHAFLADGRLLVAGGTETWSGDAQHNDHGAFGHFTGHKAAWLFHPRRRAWRRVADMSPQPGHDATGQGGGRWYPTLVTLPNGEVFAVEGHPVEVDTRHGNDTPERYHPTTNTWTRLDDERFSTTLYPRIFVVPGGHVFFASPVQGACRTYDPITGRFVGQDAPAPPAPYRDFAHSAVLLPLLPGDGYQARVLHCGAAVPVRLDLANPAAGWVDAGARQGAAANRVRTHCNATILPTGEVLVTGGVTDPNDDSTGVLEAEVYSPGIDWTQGAGAYSSTSNGSWSTAEAGSVVRNYHSTALLLPDGRVWTGGSSKGAAAGNPATVGEMRLEVYEPWYHDDALRPEFTDAPSYVSYGQTFVVRTSRADAIRRAAFVRAGTATHAFNGDQRYVAATIRYLDGDQIEVTAPPSGDVAPPGPYLLFLLDADNRPSKVARPVRLARIGVFVVADKTSFGVHEVEAQLLAGPAKFGRALYVVADGMLPHEVAQRAPSLAFTYDDAQGGQVPGMQHTVRDVLLEDPASPDVAQRVTWVIDVAFANATAFASFAETRAVNVRAAIGAHSGDHRLLLVKHPNPYMLDGPVSWLSVDVRVFQIRQGWIKAGVLHDGDPNRFIKDLIAQLNQLDDDEFHPFVRDFTEDQVGSRLELARTVDGQAVFNYAIARVRYRAQALAADNVRANFRLFKTATTALEYLPETYPHAATDESAPLLGVRGGEVASIPCFAEPRRDTRVEPLSAQTDPANVQQIAAAGGRENHAYFGAWLDINQPEPRFPLNPTSSDGPFPAADCKSIQELLRNMHLCLVVELHHDPTPGQPGPVLIAPRATPGSSDRLSQRNLVVEESDNPGTASSHTLVTTFEVAPSTPIRGEKLLVAAAHAHGSHGPDELLFAWGSLPRRSVVRVYLPEVSVDEVLALARRRLGPAVISRVDDHTFELEVGDAAFVPVPGPRKRTLAGLLSVELPADAAKKGQHYQFSVHQVSGRTREMIGAFHVSIPVGSAEDILPSEERRLAVLRHIARAIPRTDRWRPIFERYLRYIEARVRAFGGTPEAIAASPDGTPGPCDASGGGEVLGRVADAIACLLRDKGVRKALATHGIDARVVRECAAHLAKGAPTCARCAPTKPAARPARAASPALDREGDDHRDDHDHRGDVAVAPAPRDEPRKAPAPVVAPHPPHAPPRRGK